MIKKALVLGIALVASFIFLTACGDDSPSLKSSITVVDETTTIVVYESTDYRDISSQDDEQLMRNHKELTKKVGSTFVIKSHFPFSADQIRVVDYRTGLTFTNLLAVQLNYEDYDVWHVRLPKSPTEGSEVVLYIVEEDGTHSPILNSVLPDKPLYLELFRITASDK